MIHCTYTHNILYVLDIRRQVVSSNLFTVSKQCATGVVRTVGVRVCKYLIGVWTVGTLAPVMLWSLSYHTYDSITVCSLGTLVISGVAGAAIFLGISQSGGWRLHAQVGHV